MHAAPFSFAVKWVKSGGFKLSGIRACCLGSVTFGCFFMESGPKNSKSESLIQIILNIFLVLVIAGIVTFIAFSVGMYSGSDEFAGYSLLISLPFASTTILCLAADPLGRAPLRRYLLAPVVACGLVLFVGVVVHGEGVVCVLMLTPIWLFVALPSTYAIYLLRAKLRGAPFVFGASVYPSAHGNGG